MIGVAHGFDMIAAVSLRLLYLIFRKVLGLVLPASRASAKDVELLLGFQNMSRATDQGDPEHHQFGMIAAVLLRLFYLIFWHVLGPVLLMGCTASSVQHVGRGRAPIPM
jgi:hypothetical protein